MGHGQQALQAAANQLMSMAGESPILAGLRTEGLPDAAQVQVTIDREKANTFGVTFADISATISQYLGSLYVNDFPNNGRMQRVMVQAGESARMQAEGLLNLTVRNSHGGMVPFSSFATLHWERGPAQVVGYNAYPLSLIHISEPTRPY